MKLDRLLGILTTLLQRDNVTAPDLAAKFEVSRRTISRDIDTLCQAGIPIITRQGIGGGISIAEGYRLDNSILTSDELSNIIAALKGIGTISERHNTDQIIDKLQANKDTVVSLREPIIIDLASHYKGQLTLKIELIKHAVLTSKIIEFDYYYEKGESHRCIEPYFAIFQWSSWYVFGYCLQRNDWRLFKLHRLWNLSLSKDTYSPREIPPKSLDFNTQFTDEIKLTALFEKSERYKLIESYGLNSYIETDEGLFMEMSFTNYDFLMTWLLGFAQKVKVLEPKEIVDDIQASARKILSRYE